MEIYERIKQRRKELDLSADDVAEALGVSRATIYRYESAEIEKLPISIVEPLSQVLRCSIAYLMGWEEPDATQPDDCHLSNIEKKIITKYRESDAITQAMVLRALSIDEPAAPQRKEGLLA